MQVLYSMINNRAEANYAGPKVTAHDYHIWVEHWLSTATFIQREFEAEGLTKTVEAISDIIKEQKRFRPKGK